MRFPRAVMLGVLLLVSAATARAADRLQLKNLRARVEITPEDRPDVTVAVDMNGSADAPPAVTVSGDTVVVEGNLQTERKTYRVSFNLDRRMDVEKWRQRSHVQRDPPAGLPTLTAHTPLKVKVKSTAYVFARVGPSQAVDIRDNGDGEWRIGPVSQTASVEGGGGADFVLADTGSANIDLLGTGNVTLGDTQSLYACQWGSGNVSVNRVARDADICVSGVGDFIAGSVSGRLRILISDAGGVRVREGDLATLRVRTIDGLGAVEFGGTVRDADIDIGTSTRVRLHRVTGAVKKTLRQAASLEIETP